MSGARRSAWPPAPAPAAVSGPQPPPAADELLPERSSSRSPAASATSATARVRPSAPRRTRRRPVRRLAHARLVRPRGTAQCTWTVRPSGPQQRQHGAQRLAGARCGSTYAPRSSAPAARHRSGPRCPAGEVSSGPQREVRPGGAAGRGAARGAGRRLAPVAARCPAWSRRPARRPFAPRSGVRTSAAVPDAAVEVRPVRPSRRPAAGRRRAPPCRRARSCGVATRTPATGCPRWIEEADCATSGSDGGPNISGGRGAPARPDARFPYNSGPAHTRTSDGPRGRPAGATAAPTGAAARPHSVGRAPRAPDRPRVSVREPAAAVGGAGARLDQRVHHVPPPRGSQGRRASRAAAPAPSGPGRRRLRTAGSTR